MMAMDKDNNGLSDEDLDQLLAQASRPAVPKDFAARLQEKLERPADNNVIAFPQRQKPTAKPISRLWLSAIPLAASLAFGIWVGAADKLPESLSSPFITTADADGNLGIEDTESFLNGDLS
jgi:hypothetical protein